MSGQSPDKRFGCLSPSARTWHSEVCERLLQTAGSLEETRSLARQLLEHYLGYTLTKHVVDAPLVADSMQIAALEQAIARLQQHEPIQYILGKAPFGGYEFKVTPAVLIPRPETEELVSYILERERLPNLAILDLCTGSGCIAVCLAKGMLRPSVMGVDISAAALEIASQNAYILGASVTWRLLDVLREPLPCQHWDVVVSNPPYVCLGEKCVMPRNVVDYEPHVALFVPDQRPLVFYEKITELALRHLVAGGRLYLEIHEAFGNEVAQLLELAAFGQICLHKDLQGKTRWVSCVR